MLVFTLNRQREYEQLNVVWEWNPHYRGRRLWWLWERLTPYVIVNRWR